MSVILDDAKSEAVVTAGVKLLSLLIAFWTKIAQAATAKEPLGVLIHDWAVAKTDGSGVADQSLCELHIMVTRAITGADVVAKDLVETACYVLIELTCNGTFTIGQDSPSPVFPMSRGL